MRPVDADEAQEPELDGERVRSPALAAGRRDVSALEREHVRAHLRARRRLQENRAPAGRDPQRGGGLGASRAGPGAQPRRRGGGAGGEAVREGGEEGGGGRADGEAHRGDPPADRQPRVLLKGAAQVIR
ncbi:putative MORF4 family-associated protein 1-like protein UPP [Myotis lucifugus]|uniref:putative MORF4 family-associated protein 1-like protein UPP n=1 Tax=Myotis lucifugus TaxID=59463 RepID=UPI0006D71541|nr:putative MORF4 family-associated protein 1-like protein UPP [Myotis lucifugus]